MTIHVLYLYLHSSVFLCRRVGTGFTVASWNCDMSCVSTFFELCVGGVLEAVGCGSLLLSRHVSLERSLH